MTATLYLMRHGIAEDGFDIHDDERQLTEEGRRKVSVVARGLAAIDIVPDIILASPLVRAQQTAAIVASILAPELSAETFVPLSNGHAPETLLAEMTAYRGQSHIFLIGHQPSLGELASHLMTGSAHRAGLGFKKGAIAAIRVGALPPRAPGELLWFAPPLLWRGQGA